MLGRDHAGSGARLSWLQKVEDLLAGAIEQEVDEYLRERSELRDEAGHQLVVRNGYLPERTVQTGLGNVAVKKPRVRDRRPEEERERFDYGPSLPAETQRRRYAD